MSNQQEGNGGNWRKHQEFRDGQGQKRKLALTLLPTPQNTATSEESLCKSPRIMTPGDTKVWNQPVCTICTEDLFAYDESCLLPSNPFQTSVSVNCNGDGQERSLKPVLSTKCGHLFHTVCINKWFVENKEKEMKECPYCRREMMANETTRIFAIF